MLYISCFQMQGYNSVLSKYFIAGADSGLIMKNKGFEEQKYIKVRWLNDLSSESWI